ncbi:hypothetical protein IWW55_006139, partial [Coemansia sp. RSA 2706]
VDKRDTHYERSPEPCASPEACSGSVDRRDPHHVRAPCANPIACARDFIPRMLLYLRSP